MEWRPIKLISALVCAIVGMTLPPMVCAANANVSYLGVSGIAMATEAGLNQPTVYNLAEGALINDGSFENGPPSSSAWTEFVPAAYSHLSMIVDGTSIPSIYDGSWCFAAGNAGINFAAGVMVSNYVEQSIFISDSELFLKLWVSYQRNLDDPTDPDSFIVSINGTPVFSKEIDMASITYPDYIKEVIDVSDYAGQTVTLRIEGFNGGAEGGLALVDYLTIDETFEQPASYTHKNGASFDDGTVIIYTADDIVFEEIRRITAFWVGGGSVVTPTNSLADAADLNFAIYADAGGMPDGDPSGGGNAPVWSLSLAPSDPQISLTTSTNTGNMGDVTLTLDSPVTLDPGTYWLVFYPSLNTADAFYWHGSDTAFENSAMAISPVGSYGLPTTWTAVDSLSIGASFSAMAVAVETEAVVTTTTPTPTPTIGGGGGGGGCFLQSMRLISP